MIEKEWASFGHKFEDRSNSCKTGFWNEHESSPIFLQFLDCVYQIMTQFPTNFEFNEMFLIDIMDHFYSNRFTTFLKNNQKEREEICEKKGVDLFAHSLWWHLKENKKKYLNEMYNSSVLVFCLAPKSNQMILSLWKSYYLRYFISDFDIGNSEMENGNQLISFKLLDSYESENKDNNEIQLKPFTIEQKSYLESITNNVYYLFNYGASFFKSNK